MKKAHHYSSHLPVLLHALQRTDGGVLELGTGLFSTPLIHYVCVPRSRRVISVENHEKFYQWALVFEHEFHQIRFTTDWNIPDLEQPFDVVFIDHAPALQRRTDLLKYAQFSKYIVVHDTNGRQDRHYHLRELWGQFKYVVHYGKFFPQTTIVSNVAEIGEIC